ncbi:unnamed protein product, partial [Pleuronectes platessa]
GVTAVHPCRSARFIPLRSTSSTSLKRSKTNPFLFGPADAAATKEPAPPSLRGHDHSLDFWKIRAPRASNTARVV